MYWRNVKFENVQKMVYSIWSNNEMQSLQHRLSVKHCKILARLVYGCCIDSLNVYYFYFISYICNFAPDIFASIVKYTLNLYWFIEIYKIKMLKYWLGPIMIRPILRYEKKSQVPFDQTSKLQIAGPRHKSGSLSRI